MTTFKSTPLFGGAIVVDLPSTFIDVSEFRQVPDSQEVYVDANGLTSIIIDITERVDDATAATDAEALQYHYQDAFADAQETTKTWSSERVVFAKLSNHPALSLLTTQHPVPDPEARRPKPDFTGIVVLLLRLKEQKTDIVITVNVPHVPGEYRAEDVDFEGKKLGGLLTEAEGFARRIVESFEIREWGLFVNVE